MTETTDDGEPFSFSKAYHHACSLRYEGKVASFEIEQQDGEWHLTTKVHQTERDNRIQETKSRISDVDGINFMHELETEGNYTRLLFSDEGRFV